ncbi:MAG: arylamine N-acetyltransferase [Methylobacter tundripaludum]|nr:arylamine N-acetyltransferase [Methylobacter tundripaludum]
MTFDLNKYLNRINITNPEATAAGLAQLQWAQLSSIPFENIDPIRGILPDLEPAALSKKILDEGRGGYCLELNGLLGLVLTELGFNFEPILARVRMGRPEGGPRAHLAFLVNIENDLWLVDAGFGGPCPKKPLLVSNGQIQHQDHDQFRVRNDPASGEWVVEKLQNNDWFALYGFDRAKVQRCDLEAANVVCSTWSQATLSPFPEHLLMCRNTEQGRIQLYNKTLTESCGYGQTKRLLETLDDLEASIRNDFGIILTAAELHHVAWAMRFDSSDTEIQTTL